ncbi:CrcB family protein [Streptomyces buecherae]|uniref:fluoride efflux transporter FluC n=1 Tax=Streptomyces buecherae TaxID=2763006 RepID=UPI003F53F5FD
MPDPHHPTTDGPDPEPSPAPDPRPHSGSDSTPGAAPDATHPRAAAPGAPPPAEPPPPATPHGARAAGEPAPLPPFLGRPRAGTRWKVLAVVAAGGALGASARYGAGLLWPTEPDAFPWTTLGVNVVGCALIGVFLVVLQEAWQAPPLVRPFVATGVLGGFTTFSTYAVDVERLVHDGEVATALGYLALTPLAALTAVWGAAAGTDRLLAGRRAPA